MSDQIAKIKKRLEELDALIAETRTRLPVHSVKPPLMMALLDLEDEYESLLKEVNRLKGLSS